VVEWLQGSRKCRGPENLASRGRLWVAVPLADLRSGVKSAFTLEIARVPGGIAKSDGRGYLIPARALLCEQRVYTEGFAGDAESAPES